ncbi:MAG: hypothetical protein INR71_06510 [Terriglobus roseus]|nr:hypothetical protein [Terriglobus roseus]
MLPDEIVNKMLSSWKEIAHFFGKGVRTVQRWEKTLDLPIRRPPGAPSNVVLARTSDLEEWMHRSAAARDAVSTQEPQSDALQEAISELEVEIRGLAGTAPQPVEASTEKPSAQPVERIQQLIAMVRNVKNNGDHGSLRRVA